MPITTSKSHNGIYAIEPKRNEFSFNIPYTLGYIQDEPDSRDYQIKIVLSNRYKSSTVIDYTNEMSPVKNQADKGACVGFAVASVLEWQQQQEYLNELKQGSTYERDKEYNLSEQWIYHKAKEIDPFEPDTSGTTIRAAMKIVNKYGVPSEKGWKYSDNSIGSPESWTHLTAKWNKSKSYYRIQGLNQLKKTLDEIGPCAIGVIVFREFYYPVNGVVKYPSNPDRQYGGHAICAVGYDDENKRIKFKNSWGTRWGLNGYGYLPYSYIENFMIDAWVTVDANVKSIT